MDKRHKLSDSEYRKRSKEKKMDQLDVLSKTTKLDSFLRVTDHVSGPDPLTTDVETFHATSELELLLDDDANKSQPSTNNHNISSPKDSVDKLETSNNDILDTQGSVDADQNSMKLHLVEFVPTVSDDSVDWLINDVTIKYLLRNGIKQNQNADFSKSSRLRLI